MRSSLPRPEVERARPSLGTVVAIRVSGLPEPEAHRAIDAAFAAVEHIHRAMSFHAPESDVGRLNRDALRGPVEIDKETLAVLRCAQEVAAASAGSFDVTVASELVRWRRLPAPLSPFLPDRHASWRDIELGADGSVRYHRPLWIDLGGIAKGHVVDCAVRSLAASGVTQACVNAGGDLRVLGPLPERIRLRTGRSAARVPVVELADGSLASSTSREIRHRRSGVTRGVHVDGTSRRATGTRSFACVVAPSCMVANALTKVALARLGSAARLLRRYGATAHVHDAEGGWRSYGQAA
jgi:thiamine biosynthesis lipoprotein